jgi:succinate dehydrogenase / fumarate reductase membrane anchor subunit
LIVVARSPLARVRGLGASGGGTREYWQMKVTSYALLPLTLFVIGLLVALARADHGQVVTTLARPYIALPLFLFILANALHMKLGMQNVIDDYVHLRTSKKWWTMANLFFSYGASAAAAFFLLQISFGR